MVVRLPSKDKVLLESSTGRLRAVYFVARALEGVQLEGQAEPKVEPPDNNVNRPNRGAFGCLVLRHSVGYSGVGFLLCMRLRK